jgi:hypothetical protein
MTDTDVYNDSIEKWKHSRGIGTLSYDSTLDLFEPTKVVLNKFFDANPSKKVIVAIPDVERKNEWSTKLLTGFKHYDKLGNNLLQFLTADHIISYNMQEAVDLIIFDKIDKFIKGTRVDIIKQKFVKFKYILGLTNEPFPDADGFVLSEFCPVINKVTKVDVITHSIAGSTVEYNFGLNLSEKDAAIYKDYTQFIKDTVELLGDFDMILRCYHGDSREGISADHYRNKVAFEHGWNTDLDLSSEYFQNIDRYYNPNAIYERAKTFNDIIKKRQVLVYDNIAKLDAIVKLVEVHKDKKILIINKRSAFAKDVCQSINNSITNPNLKKEAFTRSLFSIGRKGAAIESNAQCVEYHPDVESRPLIDPNTGDYMKVKSGKTKGSIKTFGVTSLNKIANERFNEGFHNTISSTSSIPKEGEFEIDVIFITSPECNSFQQIQYRISSLKFKEGIKIVNIYIKGTKEESTLKEKQSLTNNKIIEVTTANDVIL